MRRWHQNAATRCVSVSYCAGGRTPARWISPLDSPLYMYVHMYILYIHTYKLCIYMYKLCVYTAVGQPGWRLGAKRGWVTPVLTLVFNTAGRAVLGPLPPPCPASTSSSSAFTSLLPDAEARDGERCHLWAKARDEERCVVPTVCSGGWREKVFSFFIYFHVTYIWGPRGSYADSGVVCFSLRLL